MTKETLCGLGEEIPGSDSCVIEVGIRRRPSSDL
jgi:hypothetical protein